MTQTPRALRLRLHGEPLAVITERKGADLSYELQFDERWIARIHRPVFTAAAQDWRLEVPRLFKKRLPPFLTNLLPERHGALRRRIARTAGLDESDEMALLEFVGHDMSGALTAMATEAPTQPDKFIEETASQPDAVERLRWSAGLGGMQLKFSADRTDRLSIPVAGMRGRWILKVPEPSRPSLPRAELAAMEWARAVGFEVPQLEIVDPREVEGIPADAVEGIAEALLVRRFDRMEDHTPIHMEEMTSVLRVHPEEKYSMPHGPHPGFHLVEVGRRVLRLAGEASALLFLRRIVFDVLVGNSDGHLKNWAFLYCDPRRPSLAPVYDVLPLILFGQPSQLALHFVGDSAPRMSGDGGSMMHSVNQVRIAQFARKVGVDPDVAQRQVVDTVACAADTFQDVMDRSGLERGAIQHLRQHWESLPLVRSR